MKKKLRRLPVGVQDFSDIRTRGFVYVDKTEILYELTQGAQSNFLSRPRRFGKSLTLSTLKHLYQCDRHLFRGLWIDGVDEDGDERWDWNDPKPVIHISLGAGKFDEIGQVRHQLSKQVKEHLDKFNLDLSFESPADGFENLCKALHTRGLSPVILIDEYDKPVLQVLEMGKEEVLDSNRSELRAFYSVLKDAAPEFLLLTGVVKLVKTSVFSELNNLEDITFDPNFAILCGMTQAEIERDFEPEIDAMALKFTMDRDLLLAEIRKHYNGFCFAAGAEGVYNPFSTVNLMKKGMFDNYWADSGTPSFLAKLMKTQNVELADIERKWMIKSAVDSLNPDRLTLLPLLLQTGYLTITDSRNSGLLDGLEYFLDFPNIEVRRSFVDSLMQVHTIQDRSEYGVRARDMGQFLAAGQLDKFMMAMKKVYTGIAYQLDDASERRYHGLFHAMSVLACNPPALVLSETPNALGRSDLVIDLPDVCYLFEFKRDTDSGLALEQIEAKEYAHQWEGRLLPDGSLKTVVKVAVVFGTEARNIVAWEAKQ
jgi:hypothetical protein